MKSFKSLAIMSIMILFSLLAAGCSGTPRGTYVWIDVPEEGLSYPDLQPVIVEGHAAGRDGVSRVEVLVDGELWAAIDDPTVVDYLASFQVEWLPPEPGTYTIQAVAFSSDGSPSHADQTRVSISLDTPTPTITETPPVTDTPTPPETEVKFWSDPETIDAGSCSNIRWEADGVNSLVFGGVEQEMEGVYQVCLCKNETYTLTVTHPDGSVEKLKTYVNVVGSCADTTPPPAPSQQVPTNGLSMACKSYQDLAWLPVSDESGISQYQVQAQRHGGDKNWSEVSGSVFGGIPGKSYHMYIECGWTYRWRVRAVDGEGNIGPWSGWWKFTDNLE